MPAAPPMIPSDPAMPLWKLRGRGWSTPANIAGPATQPCGVASFATSSPRSATVTSPQWSGPSSVSSPGLSPMKVTVWVARTASPSTRPVSDSRPLGMSSASRGQSWALASSTSCA